jgi:hypothetical protein
MTLVFDTKPGSGYDDQPCDWYQFPKRYLPIAKGGVGDWVVSGNRDVREDGFTTWARYGSLDRETTKNRHKHEGGFPMHGSKRK